MTYAEHDLRAEQRCGGLSVVWVVARALPEKRLRRDVAVQDQHTTYNTQHNIQHSSLECTRVPAKVHVGIDPELR